MKPCRPIIGKLKWIRSYVQSQIVKIQIGEIESKRLQLLNHELNKLHLSCENWTSFVTFVQRSNIKSKSLSNFLRYARVESHKRHRLIIFKLEDIAYAIKKEIPFKLLMPDRVGYDNQRFQRGYLLGLDSTIEYCKKSNTKIPLRHQNI